MDPEESKQLKDLITAYRECKTANDERHMIQREKEKQEQFRLRNIAKLIWINMLGHETDFGQLECLNTISSENFALKKIGYLGLSLFFNEKSDVLLLATNRIMIDLDNPSQYVVALALTSFCEISDAYMCETLFLAILAKTRSPHKYVKKKALLACMRVLKKIPAKVAEVEDYCSTLLDEKNHSLMICGIEVALEIIKVKPAFKIHFHPAAKKMIKQLKDLTVQYSSEYDVDGVNDPFLQTAILRFLFELCDDEIIKEDFCSLLAQVTVNLPGRDGNKANMANTSNSCNAILFECVKAIMLIDAPATLKKIGITVLSNFLTFKDINSKYISLRSLAVSAQHHKKAVQKHIDAIIECLNDSDISIRRMVLEILKMITDETNVSSVTRTLFNDMLSCTPELLKDMTPAVCQIIEVNAPTKVWYFDSMLRVMVIAGNHTEDENVNSLINLITNSPQLQAYALYKLYFAALDNQNQEGLVKTLFWLLGEFYSILVNGQDPSTGQTLPKITEDKVISMVIDLSKSSKSFVVKQIGINTLVKIEHKLKNTSLKEKIKEYINTQTKSEDYECQTRAFEYSHLLDEEWSDWKEEIFKPMPAPDASLITISERVLGQVNLEDIKNSNVRSHKTAEAATASNKEHKVESQPAVAAGNLLELDLLGFDSPSNKQSSTPAAGGAKQSASLNLLDLDGGSLLPAQPPIKPLSNTLDGLDILGGGLQTNSATTATKPVNMGLDLIGGMGLLDLGGVSTTPIATPVMSLDQGLDLLGTGSAGVSSTSTAPTGGNKPKGNAFDDLDLIGTSMVSPSKTGTSNAGAKKLEFIGHDDGNVCLKLTCSKIATDKIRIEMVATNKSSSQITNFKLAVSAAKYVTTDLGNATGTNLAPLGQSEIRQAITTANTMQGEKAVLLKIKVKYDMAGTPCEQIATINQIPVDF